MKRKDGNRRLDPPPGFPSQRVLRTMLRALAKKLQKDLTTRETLALLKQQERLSKQLAQSAAATFEMEQKRREQERHESALAAARSPQENQQTHSCETLE